tara:strand:- start:408 stop:563 length:156 start_codon:yes stop_codon:yes gene_type:complete
MTYTYRLIANGVSFDFHDIQGAKLSIDILDRFNVKYKLVNLKNMKEIEYII